MSTKRGVVSQYTTDSARPIRVSSTLPIALVVTSATLLAVGILGYDSLDLALADMQTKNVTLEDGTALKYLKLGEDYNATAPIILSVVRHDTDPAIQKTNIIEGINLLKTAPSLVTYVPDIIIAPEQPFDTDVGNALISVAEKFSGRTFLDLQASDNATALLRRNSFGSDRLTVIKSAGIANGVELDAGALFAWARVRRDGDTDGLGYSRSISNELLPISAVKYPSDFIIGKLDDTDPLTEAQISSIIFHKGFRTWEYSTTSADAIWQDARRVRIFDAVSKAVLDGVFFAIDKGINELRSAKKSLRLFMADLVGQQVMLGYDVRLDEAKTTTTSITAGEFYFIIDAQEMPSPKLISVTFNRVDRFSPLIYDILATA